MTTFGTKKVTEGGWTGKDTAGIKPAAKEPVVYSDAYKEAMRLVGTLSWGERREFYNRVKDIYSQEASARGCGQDFNTDLYA